MKKISKTNTKYFLILQKLKKVISRSALQKMLKEIFYTKGKYTKYIRKYWKDSYAVEYLKVYFMFRVFKKNMNI